MAWGVLILCLPDDRQLAVRRDAGPLLKNGVDLTVARNDRRSWQMVRGSDIGAGAAWRTRLSWNSVRGGHARGRRSLRETCALETIGWLLWCNTRLLQGPVPLIILGLRRKRRLTGSGETPWCVIFLWLTNSIVAGRKVRSEFLGQFPQFIPPQLVVQPIPWHRSEQMNRVQVISGLTGSEDSAVVWQFV